VARGRAGLIVAEGDSWFDYPFWDVLEELEDDFGYSVESVAHRGDSAEEMVYGPAQLDALHRRLKNLAAERREPKAILISAGGNDIAGDQFGVLLNHKRSGLPALNPSIVSGLIDERLRYTMVALATAVTALAVDAFGSTVPILAHGYDYPVPDGRGYVGGWWVLPGPWFEPGFRQKGYQDLDERCALMEVVVDRYNDALRVIAGGPGLRHFVHVDLRGTLSNALRNGAYRKWWGNELHPTERGFARVAERFHDALKRL
jgi:hypothetical protein